MVEKYNPRIIEKKWQTYWDEKKLFEAGKMRFAMRKEIQERNKKLHVSLDNWINIWK